MNKRVYQAAQMYKEASELMDKAEALLELEGIQTVTDIKGYYNNKQEIEVHLYSGIVKMADDKHKIADRPGSFTGYANDKNVGWIKINGVNFFQLKICNEEGMILL